MSVKSYFEQVVDFNTQFGVKLHSIPQPSIFETDMFTVESGMKLIREEHAELEQAIKDKNFVEVADAIADSIYVLLGLSARVGIDMDRVFNMVHQNNMSKFCATEQEAKDSVQYYLNNPQLGYESPSYRPAQNPAYWVVYNVSTSKILKSIKWKPVDLSFLLDSK